MAKLLKSAKQTVKSHYKWFKGDNDWQKTGKKLLKSAFYVLLAGLAAQYGDSNWYLALAPLLTALENYWKNR